MAGTEIEKFDVSAYPVLSEIGGDMVEIMAENMGDGGFNAFDLDRIKMPSGGGKFWMVPSLNGEQPQEVVEGIVVLWGTPRGYWEKGLDEAGAEAGPPDCSSDDGRLGAGMYGVGSTHHPAGDCASCPMNEWNSDPKGKGKACAEQRLLFLLQPGAVLPIAVALPPTSITPLKKYFMRLAGAGVPYYGIVSRFTLEEAKNATGQKYSKVVPAAGQQIDPETRAKAKAYGQDLRKSLALMPAASFVEQPGAGGLDPFATPAEPAAASSSKRPPAE